MKRVSVGVRRLVVLLLVVLVVGCRSAPKTKTPSVIAVDKAQRGGSMPSAIEPCADETAEPVTEDDAYGKKIAALCIEGASPKAREILLKKVELPVGSDLSDVELKAALAEVHQSGVAEDVLVFGRKAGSRVTLFLRIKERPRVGKVEVKGASLANVVVKKASEPTPLQAGEYFDPAYANERAQTLREKYVDEGFEDATVTPKAVRVGDGTTVDVEMIISEGKRSKFGTIAINGITKAFEADLRKLIDVSRGEFLSKEKGERAPLVISQFYFDRGYMNVQVSGGREPKDAEGVVPFVFTVIEGPIFKVRKTSLLKSKLDDKAAKAILASLKTQPGQLFKRFHLVADLEAIKKVYSDRGRKVSVEPRTSVDPETKTVAIALEISDAP